ncbi:MAG: N-acetylmuramoyl-L-alanine amidase [Nitrososphaera sp.]|nr:N-acetylmuramoyl-L-alanine amidase [Nitrososphaera sp.]
MNVVWIPRSEWGASSATETFIAGRPTVPPLERTNIQVHHTAAIDTMDTTPNRWTYARALAYVRRLQTSRPDLGPMPYNFNPAVSEDLNVVWLFEGRGAHKRGAHTANYNRTGIGYGILGNFDKADNDVRDVLLSAIERHAAQLRADGMSNLATLLNPRGWQAWGHRDTSTKSCPGNHLYWELEHFSLEGGEEAMRTREFVLGLAGAGVDAQGFNKRVVRLIDAKIIAPQTNAAKKYWSDLVTDPDNKAWYNFVNTVEVETSLNAAKQAAELDFNAVANAVVFELSQRLQG